MLWHDKHQQYGVRLSHPACEARPENELSWAARTGNIRMMKRLMAEHGSKLVNAHNWSGYAPLHYSIMEDSPFVFDFLITSGADVNLPIRALACKFEPLYYAVSRDRPYFCRVLLEHGANNDKVDAMGNYYLHYAAFHGQRTVCDVLLDTDAPWSTPVDARNSHGETPLLWAVRHGRVEVCRLLLGRGADWEAVADYGCCVGDFATDPEVIALIEKVGTRRMDFSQNKTLTFLCVLCVIEKEPTRSHPLPVCEGIV